ncbi:MAG: TetR/AcrR family transcriptional regulator [Sinobacteraceae bacterium]|nr:TetR/AcrR family transcriptional regulator [Nevskiaceae bacterium]
MADEGVRKSTSPPADGSISHNLAGQKLGRKGQRTRERILESALRLLHDPRGAPVTLSNVAREASVQLTNLYLYFPDIGELVLGALARVMDVDTEFMELVRRRWPDEGLGMSCVAFIEAHYLFWRRHARILHLRNTMADTDARLLEYRQQVSMPLLHALVQQMDGNPAREDSTSAMAMVILTGVERLATVLTNPNFHIVPDEPREGVVDEEVRPLLAAQAKLLELAIRNQRVPSAAQ